MSTRRSWRSDRLKNAGRRRLRRVRRRAARGRPYRGLLRQVPRRHRKRLWRCWRSAELPDARLLEADRRYPARESEGRRALRSNPALASTRSSVRPGQRRWASRERADRGRRSRAEWRRPVSELYQTSPINSIEAWERSSCARGRSVSQPHARAWGSEKSKTCDEKTVSHRHALPQGEC
jgi:hypothetical protein